MSFIKRSVYKDLLDLEAELKMRPKDTCIKPDEDISDELLHATATIITHRINELNNSMKYVNISIPTFSERVKKFLESSGLSEDKINTTKGSLDKSLDVISKQKPTDIVHYERVIDNIIY